MIVYGVKNIESGEVVYIGQTIRPLLSRWNQHLGDSRKFKYPLYRAIRKYGQEKFEPFVIEEVSTLEDLDKKEIEYTNKFNTLSPNGYNLKLGRKSGRHLPETVEKIRIASIENGFGKWQRSEKDNEKNRQRALEQHADPVKREKFLRANGSREFNVFKAIQIQVKAPGRPNLYGKGEYMGSWLSSKDCAKDLNLQASNVRNCLLELKKSHKGFVFEYKENYYGR